MSDLTDGPGYTSAPEIYTDYLFLVRTCAMSDQEAAECLEITVDALHGAIRAARPGRHL